MDKKDEFVTRAEFDKLKKQLKRNVKEQKRLEKIVFEEFNRIKDRLHYTLALASGLDEFLTFFKNWTLSKTQSWVYRDEIEKSIAKQLKKLRSDDDM